MKKLWMSGCIPSLGITSRENICVGCEVNPPEDDTWYAFIFLIL